MSDKESKEPSKEVTPEKEKDVDAGNDTQQSSSDIDEIIDKIAENLNIEKKDEDSKVEVNIDGVVEYIKNAKNIITMAGAGISTSAGIPDFRTPGTGLYDNLSKYNLPYPQAIFDIDYFKENPTPFFILAKEMYPGNFNPTPTHYFIKLLHEKGLLLRHYTQNIDTLERVTGLPDEKLVEAHGSFNNGRCIECGKEYSSAWIKEKIFEDTIAICISCGGTVKPNITFFGESLPERFFTCADEDFDKCDLLIIMGTSLKVMPFASLVNHVSGECPRVLINRDEAKFTGKDNVRDVFLKGDTDTFCKQIVKKVGWQAEFDEISKTKISL